ncbi:MAG: B12-binding domain-containing radical SAM protein [Candidatus Scalindua sp.]
MNCLLISTLTNDVRCIGLLYIYQYIKASNRHNVKLLFLPGAKYKDENIEEVINFIGNHRIQVIGISLMTFNFYDCITLTKKIKERFKDIKIAWGGIHPTIAPEECIDHADYVCVGEGEIPMLELLDKLQSGGETSSIENFWVNTPQRIIRNKIRLFEDITHYSFPRYDWDNFFTLYDAKLEQFNKEYYKKLAHWQGSAYSIIATRGCPFSCSYCCNSALKGKMYGNLVRRRGIEDIISELEYAKDDIPFTKVVNFQDDCFFAMDSKGLIEFCKIYKERIRLPFFIRTTPVHINDEKIAIAKEAGLTGVSAGLQTGDDYINNKIYNRPIIASQFMKAAEILHKYNIWAVYDVILDGPYDSEESNYKTASILSELLKPFSVAIFYMILFPKSKLFDMCKRDGIETEKDPYLSSYASGKQTFYNMLISITPTCPSFLIKYFLRKRKSYFAQYFLRKIYRFLSLAVRVRGLLRSKYAYSDKLVRTLFKVQSYFFK